MQAAEDLDRSFGDRRSRQPARADRGHLVVRGVQPVPADGGVGRDDAGQAEFEREIRDRIDVVVGQVGGDLHQNRDGHAVENGTQERPERFDGLQVPQSRGVG
nr:hypothetical protein GCM10017611_60060 [Rhodococcus wratislaviensis]